MICFFLVLAVLAALALMAIAVVEVKTYLFSPVISGEIVNVGADASAGDAVQARLDALEKRLDHITDLLVALSKESAGKTETATPKPATAARAAKRKAAPKTETGSA